ncbi:MULTISPECIES: DEAD/DEAH box helicase [unclassified Paenibacillus]|uniref:DEAD/DEAH box helicase n=1 Tax=unclassified Paenibacillus TaxID=185978 RepID=UPI0009A6CDA6|nr:MULTISPECIES: DEAD/DEAH box helicase [unclassified Paenibacillus]SLJ95544.1 ATP-dependent helicase Lhr and Lhr-like helicase [Paenibacillus sp. RU5A]SOC67309.1 ATP-dependent helicase Lhr and Lhr-like helicase [Paenibacillus sp. RU26A]SOC69323.1 ATP-dependent helicase Lhr and Lhr-like helicase [Paenibacillus sp. RU5M]
MSENPFYRLAPFVQEFIYKKRWESLRPAQIEACNICFHTPHHMLIAAGTASGKTEAAFFPALTELHERPSKSVGILYIGPLKALINDQFERLKDLLSEGNIPVWHWHGDVPQAEKTRLMRSPSGVLQITPESLEGLLMNRPNAIPALFHDLRYVIIDEVHAFMGADRGIQVLSELARIERMAGCKPRRVGLSATLSDYDAATAWLAAGTNQGVDVVSSPGGRKLRLRVEHFSFPDARDEEQAEHLHNARKVYYDFIYESTHRKKALIFTNSRTDAEVTILEMRRVAARRQERDVFHVHHGSISAMLREETEAALRTGSGPAVAAATVTLELGIDLGELERVVQLGAPYSASSFVQRLGRSGRREDMASEMLFVCPEEEDEEAQFPARMPWTLMRAIAVIELYVKTKWVEPLEARKMPMGVLYHQTMSILKSMGEAEPKELAEAMLSLAPFKEIRADQYQIFLNYLIETDHLQWTEDRTLIIGLTGEKTVNNYRFYAVFKDDEEHKVLNGSEEIGSITTVPPPGYCFSLAGKLWKVEEVDHKHKSVYVKAAKGKVDTLWLGAGGDIHTTVVQKMREVLSDTVIYPYLSPQAVNRLERARRLARESGLLKQVVIPAGGDSLYVLPWVGSKSFRTLERLMKHNLSDKLALRSVVPMEPYYFVVSGKVDGRTLLAEIMSECRTAEDASALLSEDEAPYLGKYDEFVAPPLIREAFAVDGLDLNGLKEGLQQTLTWDSSSIK